MLADQLGGILQAPGDISLHDMVPRVPERPQRNHLVSPKFALQLRSNGRRQGGGCGKRVADLIVDDLAQFWYRFSMVNSRQVDRPEQNSNNIPGHIYGDLTCRQQAEAALGCPQSEDSGSSLKQCQLMESEL